MATVAALTPIIFAGWSVAQKTQTLKTEVVMVSVAAVVIDPQGRPSTGLPSSDFRVFEDGMLQTIAEFAAVDLPSQAAKPAGPRMAPVSDVVSNSRIHNGRLLVLVLDDLQTLRGREDTVKRLAANVLERLGADDLVALVCTSGSPACACDFSTRRAAVLEAIAQFKARKTRFDREDSLRAPLAIANLGKAFNQLDALRTLTAIANRLATVDRRRKALLYVGEGVDTELWDPRMSSSPDPSTFERMAFLEAQAFATAARGANVVLYALDPRGRTHYQEEGLIRQPAADEFEPWLDRAAVARQGLEFLAEETGGFAAVDTTDFDGAVERIVRETGTYYVLGYYPSNQKRAGKFSRIVVKVNRPGLRVRARRGYFAPSGKSTAGPAVASPSAHLNEALAGPLPATGLTVRVYAAPFKAASARTSSVVGVVSAEYPIEEVQESHVALEDRLDFQIVAVDMNGRVCAVDRHAVKSTRTSPEETLISRGATARAQLAFRLEVPMSGRYSLRAAVYSARRQAVGSVFSQIEIPDFNSASLSLSGLVLGARNSGLGGPQRPAEGRSSHFTGGQP